MTEIVFKALTILDGHNVIKAAGPDGIPALVLKKCAPDVMLVLSKLYYLYIAIIRYQFLVKTRIRNM